MIRGEVLMLAINEHQPLKVIGALARACASCARTEQALVLDVSARSVDMAALREALLAIDEARPIALAVVAAPDQLGDLREISLEMAQCGWLVGAFARRDLAMAHALRERRLELAAADCSARGQLAMTTAPKLDSTLHVRVPDASRWTVACPSELFQTAKGRAILQTLIEKYGISGGLQ